MEIITREQSDRYRRFEIKVDAFRLAYLTINSWSHPVQVVAADATGACFEDRRDAIKAASAWLVEQINEGFILLEAAS